MRLAPTMAVGDGAGPRRPTGQTLRLAVAGALVLLTVLAFLALVNSFLLQPVGDGPGSGGGGRPGAPGGGGGGGPECATMVTGLMVAFIVAVAAAVLMWILATRSRSRGGALMGGWGIGAALATVAAPLLLLLWFLTDLLCRGDAPDCGATITWARTAFIVLAATAAGLGVAAWLRVRGGDRGPGLTIGAIVALSAAVLAGLIWAGVAIACSDPQIEPEEQEPPEPVTCEQMVARYRLMAILAFVAAAGLLATAVLLRHRTQGRTFGTLWGALGIVALTAGHGALGYWLVLDALCALEFGCAWLRDTLLWYLLIVGLPTMGLLAWAIVQKRRSGARLTDHPAGGFAVLGLILTGVALALLLFVLWICSGGGGGGGGGGEGDDEPGGVQVPEVPPSMLLWILAAAALVLVAVTLFLLLRRRAAQQPGPSGRDEAAAAKERQELLRLLQDQALSSRDQVVAGYRAFLAWCAARGMARERHETPTEHGWRVAASLDLAQEAIQDLVDAYEVVRLGDRDPTADERRRAQALQDALEDP